MTNQERHDDDLLNVLRDDGVTDVAVGDFENRSTVGLDELIDHFDAASWAARVFYNERFGGVLIRQMPGEGNRLHSHVVIDGHTEIGNGNEFFPFASIGLKTQDLKWKGGTTWTRFGNRNTFRDNATVHSATGDGEIAFVQRQYLRGRDDRLDTRTA